MENVYFITSDGELRHHGVKGQKWGVRRTPAELGHENAERLSNEMVSYGKSLNRANKLIDAGKRDTDEYKKAIADINNAARKVQSLIDELDKSYVNVQAIPEFHSDGYTVKYVKATMTELDRLGRVSAVYTSLRPIKD